MLVSHQGVREEEARLALQSIIASETFARSQQLSRLLKYLCEAVMAGTADRLTEYSIGAEALGRPPDFDPAQDAAVRVEMHRLRRRLREYYASEGANAPVRVEVPTGRYAPVLHRVGEEQVEAPPPAVQTPEVETVSVERPGPVGFRFPRRAGLWIGILAIVVMVPAVWAPWRRVGKAIPGAYPGTARAAAIPPGAAPEASVRIGCGRLGSWTDRLGQIWGPDEHFEGGRALEIPSRPYIAGAFDPRLFQSARTGTFRYTIPLPARTYEMRLYFVEPVFGPEHDQGGEANRLFNLAINRRRVLERFDILADADGPWAADVRVFKDVTPGADGNVRLDFESTSGDALVNAIEFVPARPGVLNPVRLLPQTNFYTDSAGILWRPDNYSRGGRVALHPGPVKNTRDQEIFRHERFGRFRYDVPVDRGSYTVYLYMAEEYWGVGDVAGGAGTRVFSVFCNGATLLRSLDLFKEFGSNYGAVRAFRHLTPNAQGKLLLSFEPEHDYASLYALEVLDEAGSDAPSYLRTMNGAGGI